MALPGFVTALGAAGQNLWSDVAFNASYLTGVGGARDQVQQEIDQQQQKENAFYAANPGATSQDWTNHVENQFFGYQLPTYLATGQTPTSAAQAAVMNADAAAGSAAAGGGIGQLGILAAIIVGVVLLFRR